MQTQELDRIRHITQTYEALKGLKMVPFGLFMIVMAIRQLGWNGLGPEGDCTYTLPLFVIIIALYFVADRYYTRTFGVVRITSKTTSIAALLIILSIFFGAVAIEVAVKPPISLIGLLIAGLLIYSGLITKRNHYSIGGAVMAGLALVPLFFPSIFPIERFSTFGLWWNMVMGLTWTALGLIDHWILVRSMKPVRGGENA